jgi:hypothetical protein
MPIVADFGPDVQEYVELGKEGCCPTPDNCPFGCAQGQVVGHGHYERKPKGLGQGYVMRIKRWRCKQCGKTFGCLPSFILSFRHYLVEVIQLVLVGRLEQGYSWGISAEMCSEEGAPALRTMQRWVQAFEEHAPEWLTEVEQELARQDSQSGWLDATAAPGSPSEAVRGGGKALLQASMYLLAWGKTRWQELAGYGLNERLRFLWHWGAGRGLPRLA